MDVGWELPLFSSDLEPHELKRLRCGVCVAAWAAVQCHRCNQQFCHKCEATAHSAASDPAAHQDESEPCNVCQACQMKGPDFFCRDCEQYQCDLCCASVHTADDAMRRHIWMCTEGAPVGLLRHDVWDTKFRDHAKMARRQQQHTMTQSHEIVKQEAGALPDFLPLSPANDDDDDATSEEGDLPSTMDDQPEAATSQEEAVQIKMERVHLHDRRDDDLVSNVEQRHQDAALPVDPQPPTVQVKAERLEALHAPTHRASEETHESPPPPAAHSPTVEVKTERPAPKSFQRHPSTRNEVVDLTASDDDDDEGTTARLPPQAFSTNPVHVKAEPAVASTWSVPTPTSSVAPLTSSFADEDLIRTAMIHEYHSLSQQLTDAEQQRTQLSRRVASTGSMQDIAACNQQLAVLKNTLIKLTHSRTAAVARLLFYLHGGDAAKLQGDVALDIPDAQAAFHRRLHDIQVAIARELQALDAAKRQMDEAVAMKSGDALAEVLRLGAEISSRETQLRTLETQRLDDFRQLAHVSAAVRSAALALVVDNEPPPAATEAPNVPRAL